MKIDNFLGRWSRKFQNIRFDKYTNYSILSCMIWRITKRHLLYKLIRKRRRSSIGRGQSGDVWKSGNFDDYLRKKYGLLKDTFAYELHAEEFRYFSHTKFLKRMYEKIRPVYSEYFIHDVQATLEKLIREDFIVETQRPEGIFIKENEENANALLAWYYYPKKFLEWKVITDLMSKILTHRL